MSENSMAIFSRASLMLAEADTIQKTKELKNLALTAADFARRKGMGEDAIQHCRSYALEAERKMGEMLATTERAKGAKGVGPLIAVTPPNRNAPPTLAAIGLSKRDSAQAQALAAMPKETFEAIKSGEKTRNDVVREIKRTAHAVKVQEAVKNPKPISKGPFDLILADPPWKYDFAETESREIENHYGTMTVFDLYVNPPNSKDSSVLFLWATAPKLADAVETMLGWGFTYKTCAVWDKQKIGMGYWFRGQHELLLVGVKGKFSPPQELDRVASIFTEARRAHSQKPECVYEWIEKAFPLAEKLEMFCRSPRKGWAAHGNEV